MTEYGIPGLRNSDGELNAVEHTFNWNGQEVTFKHYPMTTAEQQQIENEGRNISMQKMEDYIDDHMVKPSIPEDESWTLSEVACFFEGIIDYGTGGGGDVMEEARAELNRRAEQEATAGN